MSADLRRWKRQWNWKHMLQQVKPMDALRAVGADGFYDELLALVEHRHLQRESLESKLYWDSIRTARKRRDDGVRRIRRGLCGRRAIAHRRRR